MRLLFPLIVFSIVSVVIFLKPFSTKSLTSLINCTFSNFSYTPYKLNIFIFIKIFWVWLELLSFLLLQIYYNLNNLRIVHLPYILCFINHMFSLWSMIFSYFLWFLTSWVDFNILRYWVIFFSKITVGGARKFDFLIFSIYKKIWSYERTATLNSTFLKLAQRSNFLQQCK